MNKKFRIVALALCTVFAVAACNNQPAEEPVDTTPVAQEAVEAVPVEEEPVDQAVEVADKKPAAKKTTTEVKKSDGTVTIKTTLPAPSEPKKDAAVEAKAGNLTVSNDKSSTTVTLQSSGKKDPSKVVFSKTN